MKKSLERALSAAIHEKGNDADIGALVAEVRDMHPRSLIDAVERLPASQAGVLFRLLPKDRAYWVYKNLDPRQQAQLINTLASDDTEAFFQQFDPDERVRLLDELPPAVTQRLLQLLNEKEQELTSAVLIYPKGSVGRAMSPEVARVSNEWNVAEALTYVRAQMTVLETVYTLPVVDKQRRVVGVLSLRALLGAQDADAVTDLMSEPVCVAADGSAEEGARLLSDFGFLALPVLDKDERLVGILTADDAFALIEAADSEDRARSAGHEPLHQPYLSTPIRTLVRSRVVWLLVLAISAALTVQVLDLFEATLSEVVALALFIPLLTGTGGNTGNQAATTVTRALALGDVAPRDIAKVLGREVRVGLVLGSILGAVGFAVTSLIYGLGIGQVIGLTLLCVCTMAAAVGGAMPIIAKAVNADPAVFSNPFISTFCDATGLVTYFLIAKWVLGI